MPLASMNPGPRFAVLPAQAILDDRVSPALLKTLAVLCLYTDQQGVCWPCVGSIAERRKISKRDIHRHLARLRTLGYLVTKQRFRADGSETSSLNIVKLDFALENNDLEADYPPGGGQHDHGGLVRDAQTGGGHTAQPMNYPLELPTSEHPIEQERISDADASSPQRQPAGRSFIPPFGIAAAFEAWWAGWTMPGTKRGRGAAERRYFAIVQQARATPAQLTDGLAAYMAWCRAQGQGTSYIKHPATWLNAGCWDDDLTEIEHKGPRNGRPRGLLDRIAEHCRDVQQTGRVPGAPASDGQTPW